MPASVARLLAPLLTVLAALGSLPAAAGTPLTCHLCSVEIDGEYASYDGLGWTVCSTCQRASRCTGCGLPRAGRLEGEGDHCSRCISHADGCTACGRAIVERYWTVSGVPGKFCVRCREEAPECSSCRAPARDARLVDGRVFCNGCRARLAKDETVYRELYGRIARRASQALGLRLEEMPRLAVDSPQELAEHRGRHRQRDDAVCGLFVRDESGPAIHLLSHLTEARAAAVLAHEYAHAWQAENCPDEQSHRFREGFAEWVAWKVLDGMDGPEGTDSERSIIASRTDEYGLGFRIFADLEAVHGTERAIWYARSVRSESR